jgi:hypothetical protein
MGSPPVQVKVGHEAAILAANAAHVQPEHPTAEHKKMFFFCICVPYRHIRNPDPNPGDP